MHTRITQLQASNILRLRAVTIDPRGHVIRIAGRNGQGKTSTLRAIEMTLGGARKFPPQPIRDGEDHARAELTLSNGLTVTRTWSDDGGTKLVVTDERGAPARSPQKILNDLYGDLSFDPLEFSRLKPRDQYERLCTIVGIDLTEYEARRKAIYDDRTVVNREAKRAQTVADDAPAYADVGTEPLTAIDLQSELNRITQHNRAIDDAHHRMGICRSAIDDDKRKVERIDDELERLRARIEELVDDRSSVLETIVRRQRDYAELMGSLDEKQDPAPVLARLGEVHETNQKIEINRRKAELYDLAMAKAEESAALTAQIDALDAEVAERLSRAKFPCDGLSVEAGRVTFGGKPLEQCSGAETLRVSVAIACALNPELRVMLIRDGSLLDSDSMSLLALLAEQYDAQIWIERVGDDDPSAVVIEDGEVMQR